jgi:chaperone required for assembly of F1-ATPase
MRDLLTEIFETQPIDPMVSARRGARAQLRKRFYREAGIGADMGAGMGTAEGGGFALLLDGKPVVTPARRGLAAPAHSLAQALAAEWNAQTDVIDPARMPLTRLANATIDAVADARGPVAAEIEKYLGSDLLFYRAEAPLDLVERQARAWDPVLQWAQASLGARFVLAQGVMHVAQPSEAVAAAARAIPAHVWRLAAVSVITALTGSALLALALNADALEAEAAWAAAHVDEDWQLSQWGRDDAALERRAVHFADFQAAVTVLKLVT